jgi:release factor glutamine methyltransferase
MTLAESVTAASASLVLAGRPPDDARRDAALLARSALGWDTAAWLTRLGEAPPTGFVERFDELVRRRAAGEPIAYLVGVREFYGRAFRVTPAVLIPRPETELVVDEAIHLLDTVPAASGNTPLVVDVGTGSGCLAITIALERPHVRVVATDVSPAALTVAGENARTLGADARIEFVTSPLLPPLSSAPHLIVANPPYVREDERATLPAEVREYEPGLALFAGPEGLDVIRELIPRAGDTLAAGGWLVMEIGAGQATAVSRIIEATPGLALDHVLGDLQSIPRVVVASKQRR